MSKNKKRVFDFNIGADPEFSIILQNKRINAQATIREILRDKREFKSTNGGYEIGEFGNIGWDGAAETGEIRPAPAHTPEEVIRNMQELFGAFGKYMSIFELSTLSQHASIGGHIHLEAKTLSTQKLRSIHLQMISFYLPIMMAENKINLQLRLRQGYGKINDYRCEVKGRDENGEGVKTYEFRCPTAEWLTTPKVAQATLAYLSVVYNEILKNPKNIKKYQEILLKSDRESEAFQTLAAQEYGILNNTLLKNITKAIRTFEMYEPYKDEIEFVLTPDNVMKEKMKANYDINTGWGLAETHKVYKKDISSDKKFKEKMKTKDADIISKMVHIDYNNDAKVNEFCNALALRAGAFNWKLSKQYFIFGLKKGIKDIIVRNVKGDYLTGLDKIHSLSDWTMISKAFDKMARKFGESNSAPDLMTIDFKTGKPISMRDGAVLIGLPYDMRMKGKTKFLIDTIWKIENDNYKKCEVEMNKLEEGPGEIDKARAEREQTEIPEPEAIIVDNGTSCSSRNQQRALGEITQENEIEEIAIRTEEIESERINPTGGSGGSSFPSNSYTPGFIYDPFSPDNLEIRNINPNQITNDEAETNQE